MKSYSLILCLNFLAGLANASVQGFDISHYDSSVDFTRAYADGARFVYIQATEGTTYRDPKFSDFYTGATKAGFIRGGYHLAQPASSSGAAQANYFHAHGGGWSGDGITLPGMLCLEYNPDGQTCYGLDTTAMIKWISDFVNTYHAKTGRYPLIYTTTDWWASCTGDTRKFAGTCPLVIAYYTSNSVHPKLPSGWIYETIWQFSSESKYGGGSDAFNGDYLGLQRLATGSD